MKNSKKIFLRSLLSLLICCVMFVSSTFAWFTDSVSGVNNVIKSGNLDIEMYWTDDIDSGTWYNVEDSEHNTIFGYDNWEPGYTEVRYIKIVNAGSLALNYEVSLTPQGIVGGLADVINVYFVNDVTENIASRADLKNYAAAGLLSDVIDGGNVASGSLLPEGETSPLHDTGSTVVAIAMTMLTSAGNEYQNETIGDGFTVKTLATQCVYESDSFGSDYDAKAEYPVVVTPSTGSADVNGSVPAGGVTITASNGVSAVVPEGTALEDGATKLTLTVTPKDKSESNITVVNNEELIPLDVHIDGISENNTTPIIVNLGQVLPTGLNFGAYTLMHVENGQTVAMTYVDSEQELTAHNTFTYDPATGETVVAMASFSEVAIVVDQDNKWSGNRDYTWYIPTATEHIIYNADQLAGLGDIVSGINQDHQDDFSGDTVMLASDINLDTENEPDRAENNNLNFYPIGVAGAVKDGDNWTNVSGTTGEFGENGCAFRGTFDGMGHIVSNLHQNGWSMFGSYTDGENGYYNEAMGLFTYIVDGTVKNLTVNSFESAMEFAPTGCITAYAKGDCTFENISLFNCHPATYNTGVAGIIGWDDGGDTEAEASHYTFENITVDQSNEIEALWGTWDCAASGILGYLGQCSEAKFTNCNVSAKLNVYNDVCANYQYYWYRYCGMFIGTVDRTDATGAALNMDGISAKNCTVNFGSWNDYFYCEMEKNSIASYTHDYQFSRLTEVEEFPATDGDYVKITRDENGNITKSECKHYINGAEHSHEEKLEPKDLNGDGVTGNDGYLEDKACVYLPFNQVFGGYGWGVKGEQIDDWKEKGIDISVSAISVNKFTSAGVTQVVEDQAITLGKLFTESESTAINNPINSASVQVGVTCMEDNKSQVTADYALDTEDWKNGTITFKGAGTVQVTIQDYDYCLPYTINLEVTARKATEKFNVNFTNTDKYLYRVGNQNTVALGSLFSEKDAVDVTDGNVSVTVEKLIGATGTYAANASDWTQGTIQFNDTGIVKVSITDNDYCTPTELIVEVVDAKNATTATSATANNVVLLNDCTFSTISVSNGYTLYGNGFTMTAPNDVRYHSMGVGFVTLNNGTLDNVQIVCPDFSHSVIYTKNITESDNQVSYDSNAEQYGNVRSAVMVDGNSKVINSYIHGGRAAIFARSGNIVIENSTISGGAAANIHTVSAKSLTLCDVTLIQKPTQATVYNTEKTIMGFSGLFECDDEGSSTPLILEGTLVQDAWINETYSAYVPSAASTIVDDALTKTEYLHSINGEDSLNLGFTFIPSTSGGAINPSITDNRSNKTSVPYESVEVGSSIASAKVYSYKNTSGTSNDFILGEEYISDAQGAISPIVNYDATGNGTVFATEFDETNGWKSTLTVDLDTTGDYTFSFNDLKVQKYGVDLEYTVEDSSGQSVDKSNSINLTDSKTESYTLEITDDQLYDVKGNKSGDELTHTYTFVLVATKTSINPPEKVAEVSGDPLLVVKAKNSDWSCAIPALEGTQIKYWSTSEKTYKTIALSSLTPTLTGKQNGTNNYWEYTSDSDYTLKVSCGYIHESKQVYGMPVVVVNNSSNKMYFVISSTNGYVSTSTASRTVTITYEFTDSNGGTLTFSKTWQFNYNDYSSGTQYSYSDFVNGTLSEASTSSWPCVTPDTLVTLADGSQKRIDEVTYDDQLLVWDFINGEYTSMPSSYIVNHGYDDNTVITLRFADGTSVNVVGRHGFFDKDTNEFVMLDSNNIREYVGHSFIKDAASNELTKLISYSIKKEYTESWSILSAVHYNCILEGMLTLTPPEASGNYFMPFEVGENMKFDSAKMQDDIEKYGLFTYEEFADRIPENVFYALNGPQIKVAIGKGIISMDELNQIIDDLAEKFDVN